MLSGVERRRVELPGRGVELALLDWGGDGPLALLAHANGFCAALWDLVATRLREHFRVVAYDSRGHGDSSRPPIPHGYGWGEFSDDLIALAESLLATHGGDGLIFGIGHSMGGTTTLAAAARRPDLFARIALLDPVLIPPEAETTAERQQRKSLLSETARRRRPVWASRDEARAAWRQRELFAGWDPRALDLYLAEGLGDRDDGQVELKCPPEVEATIFEHGGQLDIFALAAALRVPALLLFATGGNFDRAVFERLQGAGPYLRLEDVEAGHLLPMEAPGAVAERLVCFGTEG